MNIAFYIDELNYRGITNSVYQYSYYNEKILKNKSIIFYNKKNRSNKKDVLQKFKKYFKVIGVDHFSLIDEFKNKFDLDYIYTQKGGERDQWKSKIIKTLVHCVYPQKLKELHGTKYAYISEWLSRKFSNSKIPFVPYIVTTSNLKTNLKKKLNIKNKQIVFGCHGGKSSFDLKFVHDTLIDIVKKRKDIVFLFLNINKFCKHPRIIFLKGSFNETFKKKFINTCDAMIYGRSLGESFGLACAEFSSERKKIISYKFVKHKSHIYNLPSYYYEEYSSKSDLFSILTRYSKKNLLLKKINKYSAYSPKKIMKIFENVFLKESPKPRISIFDNLINFLNFFKMYYQYLRHKIYSHFYRILN